ncbi:hypothetical protein V6Z11_D10G274200 [Gossypium hirsutum]
MAFASVFRKSTNSLAPLAIRLTRVQRNYHSFIFRVLNHGLQAQKPAVDRFYPNSFHFFTAVASKKPFSDESLIQVLESCWRNKRERDNIICKKVALLLMNSE